ncbi:MAG: hypothetical protein AAF289_08825 [Cyanobacteria bacterium P01_A01_bin.135]
MYFAGSVRPVTAETLTLGEGQMRRLPVYQNCVRPTPRATAIGAERGNAPPALHKKEGATPSPPLAEIN